MKTIDTPKQPNTNTLRTMFRLPSPANGFTCRLLAGYVVFFVISLTAGTSTANASAFAIENWTSSDGLPSSSVFGLARAQDGFLWVGTDKGAARFDGTQFTVFTHENLPGLRRDTVSVMAAGPDSQLYIGTWGGGLTVLNHGHTKTFGKAEGAKSNVVKVVIAVGTDEAWYGTDNGYLYHYRNGSLTEIGSSVLPRLAVFGLAKAPDGTLWIGTGDGLFCLSHDAVTRYKPKVALPATSISDLAITNSGIVFAASDLGVIQIQGEHWRLWTTKEGLPSNRIQVMTAAPGEALWVGTDLGVAQLAGDRVKAIRTPPCSVLSLAFDTEKSLWMGCDEGKGLLRLRQPPVRMLSFAGELHSMGTR